MQQPMKKPGLWRRTPPAIFPPIMGLFGLGLAWRRAGEVTGFGDALSQLILGAVILLFLFAALAYGGKVARRAGVVAEDLKVLPGRAGLSALTLSVLLFAAALVRVRPMLAEVLMWGGFALHGVLAILVARALLSAPPEQRRVTPVWHLSFVGFILVPLAAVPLGYTGMSTAILYGSIIVAAYVWAVSAVQFVRAGVPAPLRPLLAIHLAPAGLFTIVAASLGYETLAIVFCALVLAILAVLIVAARWLTAAGFSPLWGAFTFPMAAAANACLSQFGQSAVFYATGGLLLVAATLSVPAIAWKIMQAWARGQLAAKTNAAEA